MPQTKEPAAASAISKKDYWHLAAQGLGKDDVELTAAIDALCEGAAQSGGNIADEAIAATNRNRNKLVAKQWKISLTGRQITIRDQLGKILNILQVAKDIGSTAASLDPVHAGLPWAGVCLLMQLVLQDSTQYSAIVSETEEIASIILRYKQVEAVYLDHDNAKLKADFETLLVALYKLILKYEIAAAIYYQRNTMIRFLRSIPKLDDKSDLIAAIRKADNACRAFGQIFDAGDSQLRHEEILDLFQNHEKMLEGIFQDLQNQDKVNADILRWISEIPFDAAHYRAKNKLADGYLESGKWLSQHQGFISWNSKAAKSPIFWLHGPVGTGKSSIICLTIEEAFRNRKMNEKIAYFYCLRTEGKATMPAEILSSLLRQLVWSHDHLSVSEPVKSEYRERKEKNAATTCSDLSVVDSVKLLRAVIENDTSVTIIIDALDECSDYAGTLKALISLSAVKSAFVKILVSSRENGGIRDLMLNSSAYMTSTSNNSTDLSTYIDKEMEKRGQLLLNGSAADLESRLQDLLKSRAQGMFRWVELQLSVFLDQESGLNDREDVVQRLDQLEETSGLPDLNAVYEQCFNKNTREGTHSREVSVRIYQWLSCLNNFNQHSISNFTIKAFIDAISLETPGKRNTHINEDYILRICSNLVISDSTIDRFLFAHLSVSECLKDRSFLSLSSTSVQVLQTSFLHLELTDLDALGVKVQEDWHALTGVKTRHTIC